MRKLYSQPTRQRGIAIITVMLMVTLATVAVTAMVTQQRRDIYRAGNRQALIQAKKLALAGERFAVQQLHIDRQNAAHDNSDSFEDDWDNPTPPFPVAGGTLAGCIIDMQGRFNLNGLVDNDSKVAAERRDQFQRLLDALGIDTIKRAAIIDWLDGDANIINADGAEDDYYSQLDPPYVPANRRFVSLSELKLVKGFNTPNGAKDYETLLPHISALPESTPINVNTATPAVIESLISFVDKGLAEDLSQWSGTAWEDYPQCGEAVVPGGTQAASNTGQTKSLYSDIGAFTTEINRDRKQGDSKFKNDNLVSVESNYFEARIDVELGDIVLPQFSLLHRDNNGIVTVLSRARGDNLLQISP